MKSITFTCPITDGSTRTINGYPTATPGLVVHQPPLQACGHDECWTVSCARSGECFPFCWTSPEAALAFAEHAGQYGSWQITGPQLARRMSLPFVQASLERRARALDGLRFYGPGHAPGRLDNGVVA